MDRRTFLLAGAATLAGCASLGYGREGPPVPAPEYRVGDRWTYRARDGFMTPVVWDETHEVIAAGVEGIRVRVTQRGPSVGSTREELLAAPGLVRVGAVFDDETRRFDGTLKRYDFPLVGGKVWNQWIGNYNDELRRKGDINRWVRVGGWSTIVTPAGTFDAVALRVVMHLDDDEFWRDRTECTYLTWYAPAVRNFVRDQREAEYQERGNRFDTGRIRSQHALVELVSYAPA
jgi:hypothetical protein